MILHSSGAIHADPNSTELGTYTRDGRWNIKIDGAGQGIWAIEGGHRVVDHTATEPHIGIYSQDGSFAITIVDGSTPVGFYAPNGSINVYFDLI